MAFSSQSNTRAFSVTSISLGEMAECFTTAPSGAKLPFRMAMAPCGLIGAEWGLITSVGATPLAFR